MVTNPGLWFRFVGYVFSGFFGVMGTGLIVIYYRVLETNDFLVLMVGFTTLWCSWSIFRDAYGTH